MKRHHSLDEWYGRAIRRLAKRVDELERRLASPKCYNCRCDMKDLTVPLCEVCHNELRSGWENQAETSSQ